MIDLGFGLRSNFRLWSILISVCVSNVISGQDSTAFPVLQTELNFHVGKLVKIHGEYPPTDITSLTELNLSWKTRGNKYWQTLYCFPSVGFSLTHAQFGNQDVLGQAIGFVPTMRFEKWKEDTRWSIRAGLGVAYFTKPYNSSSNPENLVIGSPWANMSLLKMEFSKPLFNRFRYNVGLSLMHCSNAHVDVPNIGANLIAFHAGISFSNKPELLKTESEKTKSIVPRKPLRLGIQTILGIHEFKGTTRPVDGPKYFVYGASVFASKSFKPKRRISVGMNYHYYTAYHDYALLQELYQSDEDIKKKSQNLVLFGGCEWNYGRMAFYVQLGINLYNPFLHEMNKVWDLPKNRFINLWTANKIGYKLYAYSQNGTRSGYDYLLNPYLNMAVKTNGGTADFLELGIGIEIGNPKRNVLAEY